MMSLVMKMVILPSQWDVCCHVLLKMCTDPLRSVMDGGGCYFAFQVLFVLIPMWVCGR
jgi:hypothetical protein